MVDKVKGEGLNFVIPFWQWPLLFDVRTTPKTIKTETPTKDLQRVNIGLRVLYRYPTLLLYLCLQSKFPSVYFTQTASTSTCNFLIQILLRLPDPP